MDIIRRNLEIKRANHDIHRMREQIDTLKWKMSERMIERTNLIYNGVV